MQTLPQQLINLAANILLSLVYPVLGLAPKRKHRQNTWVKYQPSDPKDQY